MALLLSEIEYLCLLELTGGHSVVSLELGEQCFESRLSALDADRVLRSPLVIDSTTGEEALEVITVVVVGSSSSSIGGRDFFLNSFKEGESDTDPFPDPEGDSGIDPRSGPFAMSCDGAAKSSISTISLIQEITVST
jgi:hypothetical protein